APYRLRAREEGGPSGSVAGAHGDRERGARDARGLRPLGERDGIVLDLRDALRSGRTEGERALPGDSRAGRVRSGDEIRARSASLLASERDGRADARQRLSPFSGDGEGGNLSAPATRADPG